MDASIVELGEYVTEDPQLNISLEGRRALVTGASKHLGSVIAVTLAARGATVAVNYRRSLDDARAVLAEMGTHGEGHVLVQGDVSRSGDAAGIISLAVASLGGLDILVNNAGPYGVSPLSEVDESEWLQVTDSNLKGAWMCARAAAPHLARSEAGRIINLSAVSSRATNRGSYGLAKAGVEILTEQLALEMAQYATVNAVAPGQILESLHEMQSLNPEWARAVLAATPSGRLVTRQEVAEVVALLCTDPFGSVTGTTLRLDGGLGLNRF